MNNLTTKRPTLSQPRKIEEQPKKKRRAFTYVFWFSVIASWAISVIFVFIMYKAFEQRTEFDRKTTIESAYRLELSVSKAIRTRQDRLSEHVKLAKSIILQDYPKCTLIGDELDQFLIANWESAERYSISPWIALSFAAAESQFTKNAQSTLNGVPCARGVFQILPGNARAMLGDDYFDGCEFNPIVSLKLFYRIFPINIELYRGDIEWAAAAYYSGNGATLQYFLSGATIRNYMDRFRGNPTVNLNYPFEISAKYKYYLEYAFNRTLVSGR